FTRAESLRLGGTSRTEQMMNSTRRLTRSVVTRAESLRLGGTSRTEQMMNSTRRLIIVAPSF
ncbi:hypothetical protein, partial [Enterococcus gallinarum]|uniref:hypothetical protein n=1 Tax=Enterococcus gallinarum TaxID=1353 RepID=UPI0032E3CE94